MIGDADFKNFLSALKQHIIFLCNRAMRKARVIQKGATYHVVAKANRGEFILDSKEMKELLLSIIEVAKKNYNFRIIHYCIMSSHIHLLLKPEEGTNLSELMRWILAVFALRYNKSIGIHGHVWYDRFKSNIIRSPRQFIHTFQYISNNPLKAGICSDAQDYAFNGLYELKKQVYRLLDPPGI